jgi:transposase-like protein
VDATPSSLHKGHRFPVEIISHCVWLYHRFPLSLRDVEQMMAQRGVSVSYNTIHFPSVRTRSDRTPQTRQLMPTCKGA